MFVILPIPNNITSISLKGSASFLFAAIETVDDFKYVDLSGLIVVAEFFLGMLIALPARLLIAAVETWSELLDSGRGQTLGAVYNPMSGAPGSQSSQLFSAYVWAALVTAGFLPILLAALFQSFDLLPAGELKEMSSSKHSYQVLLAISITLQTSILRYLPIAALFFVADVLIGFCSKALNNSHFYSENFQLKTYLSILFLIVFFTADLPSSLLAAAEPRLEWLMQYPE